MPQPSRLVAVAALAATPLLHPAPASAQEPAKGISQQSAATSGATEVGGAGFQAAAKPAEEAKDATEAKITAGVLFTDGNSDSLSVTGAAGLRLRRIANQFTADTAVNYGESTNPGSQSAHATLENYQARARYDRFLSGSLAAFLSVTARRDRFQGLDLRLNLDPGLAYYFVDEAKTQLWTELGYDAQYDARRAGVVALDPTLERTEWRHSGRAFAGYGNALSENVTFKTGLEFLLGIPDTKYWRLNWESALSAKIGSGFSSATTLSVRHDDHPLPGVEKTDTILAVSLVYQLL